ncbi:collagen alpha-1(VIII) chain-like [Mytilus californianus]|uniref:collagen alpha-1(VIII) chain-like n=1 Tax=Mytilus californianus TaxID=6549 RepID=UPI0022474334|nr:collagen alpha-1(VIII) chain-like [Mytilus californianus]
MHIDQGASNPVAVTAGLTHDISLPHGGTVVFNKVFTNLGNGYDSSTGYFEAPIDGTFLIHYFARSLPGHVGHHANQIQAFSAVLTKNQNDGRHTTKVVWDKLYSNHGGNFNMSTGIFTASVPGVYIFSYHALSQEGEQMWLELYHNYVYVNSLYGKGHLFSYGSNAAVLKLAYRDIVYIDMKDYSTRLFGAANEIYGSFTGYLLVPMDGTSIAGR